MFSVRQKLNVILERLEAKGSRRPQALRNHAIKRFGADHPDTSNCQLFPVPLLIIGTKYDGLKTVESYVFDLIGREPKKMLCKMMRYIAHTNGASILFHSTLEESLNSKARQFISHLTFKTTGPKAMMTDHNKPLLVLAGLK